MRQRRGRLLKSMEESVVIRREMKQRRANDPEFTYPVGEAPVKAVILPQRFNPELQSIEIHNTRYVCNIVPPLPEIRSTDEVVRNAGMDTEEVLTVAEVSTVQGIQQLILESKASIA